mgnify:CR=1 FL=1
MARNGDKQDKGNGKKPNGNGRNGIGKSEYEDRLEPLQVELNRLARWASHNGRRVKPASRSPSSVCGIGLMSRSAWACRASRRIS